MYGVNMSLIEHETKQKTPVLFVWAERRPLKEQSGFSLSLVVVAEMTKVRR